MGKRSEPFEMTETLSDIATSVVDLQGLYAAQELLLDDLGGIGMDDPYQRAVREGLNGLHAGMGYVVKQLAYLARVSDDCHAREIGAGTNR